MAGLLVEGGDRPSLQDGGQAGGVLLFSLAFLNSEFQFAQGHRREKDLAQGQFLQPGAYACMAFGGGDEVVGVQQVALRSKLGAGSAGASAGASRSMPASDQKGWNKSAAIRGVSGARRATTLSCRVMATFFPVSIAASRAEKRVLASTT